MLRFSVCSHNFEVDDDEIWQQEGEELMKHLIYGDILDYEITPNI